MTNRKPNYCKACKALIEYFSSKNEWPNSPRSWRTDKPDICYVDALEDTSALCIHVKDMHFLFNNFPELERYGRLSLVTLLEHLIERIASFRLTTAREKYSHFKNTYPTIYHRIPLGSVILRHCARNAKSPTSNIKFSRIIHRQDDRHYHNLMHLNSMLSELKVYKVQFANWDTIIFAITYHDLIYNTFKNNNEERSAEFAVKRLTNIRFPEKAITFCEQLILATKKHEPSTPEINLITDADLLVSG